MSQPAPDATETTTLDHVDQITIPGRVFDQPANEYWGLVCMWHGMEFLYRQAAKADQLVKQRFNLGGNVTFFSLGNVPDMPQIPMALLTCGFHWYAVSACQYVRTVGAIAYRQDTSRPKPRAYVEAVIPEVLAFRDKVAAHFAGMTQNKNDNDAERLASIIPPLTIENDAWHVAGITVAMTNGNGVSASEVLKPWSLSRVHERLRARYWPGQAGPPAGEPPAA